MKSRWDYTVGLRIDVDTYRGTRVGVPRLLEILADHHIQASFFFSVGPDNMGRHLWRLFRPAFFVKMLRSNAPGLYGWSILLRGTLWPGPIIGKRLCDVIRSADLAGHELGLHAWDHHHWQTRLDGLTPAEIHRENQLGMDALEKILRRRVSCSATAGWKCNRDVLLDKNSFGFLYNSDCRGTSIFKPVIDNVQCVPQIPVTLPTYDEVIGRDGIADANYNQKLLSLLKPEGLNVLAIHAEVEGIARSDLFRDFLYQAAKKKVRFLPLGKLLPPGSRIPHGGFDCGAIAGREGDVCRQVRASDFPPAID
jgi:undecaprenyl phosphate-alpha-L-ara4FN deformylase